MAVDESKEKLDKLQELLDMKNTQKELRSEFDATSTLVESIKEPMRKIIEKKRVKVDKEFEKLYKELVKKYDEETVLDFIL